METETEEGCGREEREFFSPLAMDSDVVCRGMREIRGRGRGAEAGRRVCEGKERERHPSQCPCRM
jgi:hypothetical protein